MRRRLAPIVLLLALPSVAHAAAGSREAEDAVRAAGFGEIADRAGAAARPTVRIGRRRARLPRRLGTSRLGGPPDLPAGTRWPSCRGRPQTFLAQLRVRDLPRDAAPLRRIGGRLWVFTHVEIESPDTGYGLWAGACTRIVHAPVGTPLRRTARPRRSMRLRPAGLRYRVRTDVPDVSSDTNRLAPPMDDVAIAAERAYDWATMRYGLNQATPDWQHPVWEGEHRLLGYLDTPNGESGRCWSRTRSAVSPWRHLLTVGHDERIGFEVADGGRLQVAIDPRDLRRGSFRRVCGIFDSG